MDVNMQSSIYRSGGNAADEIGPWSGKRDFKRNLLFRGRKVERYVEPFGVSRAIVTPTMIDNDGVSAIDSKAMLVELSFGLVPLRGVEVGRTQTRVVVT